MHFDKDDFALSFDRTNDNGWLTDVRTAIAGAIAIKHLAPSGTECVGIIGTGAQARFQAQYIKPFLKNNTLMLWGRNEGRTSACKSDIQALGYTVDCPTLETLARECDVIITTTPAKTPVVKTEWISQKDVLIVAVGADAPGKQELDTDLIAIFDHIYCDNVKQCLEHGEIHTAHKLSKIDTTKIKTLGDIIGKSTDHHGKVLADLTGVAAQDIAIAKHVYLKWSANT